MSFANGDHRLQSIGVNEYADSDNAVWLVWKDNNYDDPVHWSASYRLLREGRINPGDLT